MKLPDIVNWANIAFEEQKALLTRPTTALGTEVSSAVEQIAQRVKADGDQAIRDFTEKLDKVSLGPLRVSKKEFAEARALVSKEAADAVLLASRQIEAFHKAIKPQSVVVESTPGVVCMREARPIDKVGLYIPGGTAPLLSTVLMLGIPARIAGCRERIVCTPPQADGRVNPYILFAAEQAGITDCFKIGGAQAIAAMAYGTRTVPKVEKIFGPGNAYVTAAKMLVAQDPEGAAYDMPAGPSEVLVICDQDADPEFVAADLLSQAEHDVNSQVVLVATDEGVIGKVGEEIRTQLADLPRRDIASSALENSVFILVADTDEAVAVSNEYAPEHLIVQTVDAKELIPSIQNAGSVFIGAYSPESVGDYASGTNHVLPTYGYTRSFSGVSVDSFVKQITFQSLTADGLQALGPAVEILAKLEGLQAHEYAVTRRLAKIEKGGL